MRQELTDRRTPEDVRRWILSPPGWIEVRDAPESGEDFATQLHAGERESILLAEAVRADVLLVDEQAGRRIAMERKLPVSGTLGVLERADAVGLVRNFAEILRRLQESGFYLSEPLKEILMERHRARRSA
ncbi:MAG TPA: DUF3368 domain-containing protein [Candidatus Acidoferrales bacterium]|nr:DUF3368 domain-containing protein [Candidatus Acidoferrales bacterium]